MPQVSLAIQMPIPTGSLYQKTGLMAGPIGVGYGANFSSTTNRSISDAGAELATAP